MDHRSRCREATIRPWTTVGTLSTTDGPTTGPDTFT